MSGLDWWIWAGAALVLGLIELIVPGFVFLGFAIGAAFVALIALVLPGLLAGLPLTLVIFALASVLAWVGLRRVLGTRPGQVKIIDRDINED